MSDLSTALERDRQVPTEEPTVIFSEYSHVANPVPTRMRGQPLSEWGAVQFVEVERKEDAPLYSMHGLHPKRRTRANANVIRRYGAELDIDHGGEAEAHRIVDRLLADGVAFRMYETFSSTTQDPRYRIDIPFARPCAPSEYPRVHAAIVQRYAPTADPACKDLAHQYYVPSKPIGDSRKRVGAFVPGQGLLDPMALLATPAPSPAAPIVTSTGLPSLNSAEYRAQPGDLITSILTGRSVSDEQGNRNNGLFRAVCALNAANAMSDEEMFEAVQRSVVAMRNEKPNEPFTDHEVRAVIESARRYQTPQSAPANTNAVAPIFGSPIIAPDTPSGFSEIFAALPPVDWLVRHLDIAPGAATLIAGYGFSGKTMAAQSMCVSVATGRTLWGQLAVKKGRVLHLDYEQGKRLTFERYQRLTRGLDIDPRELEATLRTRCLPPFYLNTPGAEEQLVRECEGHALLLVDSLRAATPGVDENSSDVRRWIDMLGRISERSGASVVLIHHARKPSGDAVGGSKTAIRGSGAIFDACASVLVFSAESGQFPAVSHEKARISGKPAADFSMRISDTPNDGVIVTMQARAKADQLAGVRASVIEALRESPCTRAELIGKTSRKRENVLAVVGDLLKSHEAFERDAGGRGKEIVYVGPKSA